MANKDAYYFSHDSNALTDPKILSMRCDYGLEGYGLYWAILEMLRNESTYKLPLDKNTYRAIKMQTGTTIDVEQYINDCINEYKDSGSGLFSSKDGMFWSESFLRRMQKYETLKDKRRQAANARWNKENEETKKAKNAKKCKSIKGFCKSNASAYKKVYKCNAKFKKLYAKKCKLNQIKLNEIKLNKIKSIYPSNHVPAQNENIQMDEIDEIELNRIINNCELHVLDPALAIEIKSLLKELYLDFKNREKIQELNSKMILYALKQFAIANTKTKIQKPKEYFKKCILTAIEQTELSSQFDVDTIYELEGL